jgi:hypothetical protein
MPTLGEFVRHATQYGFRRRQISLEVGSQRRVRIVYLWRDADHFAELPDVRQSDRLTRVVVESLCRQLDIPGEDFGVGG